MTPGLPRLLGITALCGLAGVLGHQDPIRRQRIAIEAQQRIAAERPPFPLVESYLAVDPTNASNLLVSAMSVTGDQSVIYVSHDAGATWTQAGGPAGPVFPGGDPMLIFDDNGRAYFSTIAPGFRIWRSADAGRTWSDPVGVGDPARYDDRQWLAASSSSGRGQLPIFGTAKTSSLVPQNRHDDILTTVSRDGGLTFEPPQRISVEEGYLQAVTSLVVRADGTVLMPYLVNHARLPDGRYRGTILIRSSRDGRIFSEPRQVAEYLSYGDGAGDRRWKGLGVTPIAEDRSGGPHAGTIYMTWSAPLDDLLQILISRSQDGGRSWSAPMRVNRGGLTSNHSSPMMAVGDDGVVAVSWNDRRDDPQDLCSRLYIALSLNGGRTFDLESRVADLATCPGSGSRWMNGGETHGLAALPGGEFRVVWSAGSADDLHLWTARVRPEQP